MVLGGLLGQAGPLHFLEDGVGRRQENVLLSHIAYLHQDILVGSVVVLALEGTQELVDFVLNLLDLHRGQGGELDLADDGNSFLAMLGRRVDLDVHHDVSERNGARSVGVVLVLEP